MWNTTDTFKSEPIKLVKGASYHLQYTLEGGKVIVTRDVYVVGEDKERYFVNTASLTSTPICKDDIVKIIK